MSERQYVKHAITGEPVPVLTPEEQTEQQAERERNPAVLIAGVRCWCGAEKKFKRKPFWIWSQDSIEIVCGRGHRLILRYVPETVS